MTGLGARLASCNAVFPINYSAVILTNYRCHPDRSGGIS